MVVTVWGRNLDEGPAAITALVEIEVVAINRIAILGISSQVRVVPGAGEQILVCADFFPRLSRSSVR